MNARVYWLNDKISSIGLRPLLVYGVGRELSLTSDALKAIKACVLNIPFTVKYKGKILFHYSGDIAIFFINCSLILLNKDTNGAYCCNIGHSANWSKTQNIFFSVLN